MTQKPSRPVRRPEYRIVDRSPTAAEYERICRAVGWADVMPFDAAPEALARSLFAAVAEHRGEAVGMARVVGDGAMYFYVQDVAVVPEHRRRGVAGLLLDRLLTYLARTAPPRAFIGLFSTQEAAPLYARHGFREHPVLRGMFRMAPIGPAGGAP